MLVRISELFGCSLDYLLKESVTEKDEKPAAMVALGATKADGTLYTHFTGKPNDFSGYDIHTVLAILQNKVPSALKWLMDMALSIACGI